MFLFLALEAFRCTHRQQNFDPGSDYKDFVGKGRGAVIRATVTNCPYSPASQGNWDYAATLFPQVNFMEIDCAKSPQYCSELPIPYEDRQMVPFYVVFPPDSSYPIVASLERNTVDSQHQSRYFADYARKWLSVYPLLPPIQILDNQSVSNFYNLNKFKALVLYSSTCVEASDYVGKWLDMFGNQYAEDLALGVVDCDKYSTECQRWSKNIPAAIVIGKSGAYVEVEPHLGDTIQTINVSFTEAIRQVQTNDPSKTPVPIPYTEKPAILQTPLPKPVAKTHHTALNLEQRDPQDIIAKFRAVNVHPVNETFIIPPNANPCNAGAQSQEDKDKTLALVNFVRELVGITTAPIQFNATRDPDCQHDANVMRVNKVISHELSEQTGLMCYTSGVTGIASKYSALALGPDSAWSSVFGLMYDSEDHNYYAGHRRALLDPRYKTLGLGYSQNIYSKQGAAVLQMYDSAQLPVYYYPETLPFIAWPAPGPFPVELLSFRWSIESAIFHPMNNIETKDVTITVQRDDGIIFRIKSMYIDHITGLNQGLIFDINGADISLCAPGRNATVMIHVKKGEIDDSFEYTISFVDTKLQPAKPDPLSVTFYGLQRYAFITQEDKNGQSNIGKVEEENCKRHSNNEKCYYLEKVFSNVNYYNDSFLNPYDKFFSFNNYSYEIDMLSPNINLGDFDLRKARIGRLFKFHFHPFDATLTLANWQNLYIEDPSKTNVILYADLKDDNTFKAATFKTLGQAKSVKIILNNKKPMVGTYSQSMQIYSGLPCPTELVGQTLFEDTKFDLTIDTVYDNGLNLRVTCINNSQEFFLEGSTDWWQQIPVLDGKAWSDLKFLKPTRRVMEVHFGQKQGNLLKAEDLPLAKRDYLFDAQGAIYGFPIEQSPAMYSKMRKLMIQSNYQAGVVYSVDLDVSETEPLGRLLDFQEVDYIDMVKETNFRKFSPMGDTTTFYTRKLNLCAGYNDKRKITVVDATSGPVTQSDDTGFVYELKGTKSVTFTSSSKRTQASIVYTAENESTVTLNSLREYAFRDIPKLALTLTKATKVSIADSNVTLDAPANYELDSYEVKDLDRAFIGHPTKTIKIKNVYIGKNSQVEFKNVEITTLVVEDCQVTIIGGKIDTIQNYGSTIILNNVDVSNTLFQIVKRDTAPQVIVQSAANNAFTSVAVDYTDTDSSTKTFALFKGLTNDQCTAIKGKITHSSKHSIECVEQKDINNAATGKYKIVMKGNYQLPPPPADPPIDQSHIPETIPPDAESANQKYCLYSMTPSLCGNAKFIYDTWNISLIFSQYDSDPIVYVHEDVTFIHTFTAIGPITFEGKGSLIGRVEVSPLCSKFSSHVKMNNVKLNILDDGTTMGYAESVFSPMLINVVHKTKPTKDTTSLNSLVYMSKNSSTFNVGSDVESTLISGIGLFNYGIIKSSSAVSEKNPFTVNYTREVIPDARFCIDMTDTDSYNCRTITLDKLNDSVGKADKVTLYFGKEATINTNIYPDGGGRTYVLIAQKALTFNYDTNVAGAISSLTIENSTSLKFVASKQIAIQAVTLKNVQIAQNAGQDKISFLNLFAPKDIKAQFVPESTVGKTYLSPDDTSVTATESGTLVIPPTTTELAVSSSAAEVNLQPVIKPEQQTNLILTGEQSTTFNVHIPDVKVTLPAANNASVVLNNVVDLEVGRSNTTISKIVLDNSVPTTTITGSNKNDIVNVNSLEITGNTSIVGNNGKVNVGNLNLASGIESTTTNVILSSELSIGDSSVLLLQKSKAGNDLSISMSGKSDSLPFISTDNTNGFSPKALNVKVDQAKSKLLDSSDKILVNGLTKDECAKLVEVTSVSSTEPLYPKCINVIGTYNLVLSSQKPANVPGDNSNDANKPSNVSAATIGIVIAAVVVVVIVIVVVVVVVKKRKNSLLQSSSDEDSDMKTRLSDDPKMII